MAGGCAERTRSRVESSCVLSMSLNIFERAGPNCSATVMEVTILIPMAGAVCISHVHTMYHTTMFSCIHHYLFQVFHMYAMSHTTIF